ncbi:MAG TPA: TetR/AcrR family transcriptional regulator, partial [Erysipelothrix sp.]|nr:TetR/AcrR family transcriptional regulator [Erysipelothrix sp.]
ESLYIDKQMFIDYYRNFAKHYITQIEKAIEENEMKNVDPEVTSYVLMGISNFIGLRYAMFDQDRDLEDVADEVIKIIDLGLFK